MAVSAVMNKTTSTRVSERKRAVIEQIAREMGYRSNVVARTLRGGESRMIGILIDSCAPPWLYNILRHIESEATAGGYRILISEGHDSVDNLAAAYEKFEVPSLKALLDATVNQKSKDKQASPELAGETLRAILNDTPYPATLLNGVVLRIRAEHAVTWARAAILKAYYLKKPYKEIPEKEVLTVSLNEASTNIPYNLGRLFSVLEAIQQNANPGINATIKDKYFNSASATPAVVFPVLINLAQKHLKKLAEGQRIYFEKQLQAILDKLGEDFPNRLNLPQQGAFQLGYYHQTQARYQKKEEN